MASSEPNGAPTTVRRFAVGSVRVQITFRKRDVTTDDSAAAIVSYVISLAHTLRFEVVAEGVETEDQYAFLRLNGCDRLQGFLFSPARTANEMNEVFTSLRNAGL